MNGRTNPEVNLHAKRLSLRIDPVEVQKTLEKM
jgi:hypothetical protein